jgi:hypothetical protein
MHVTAYVRSLLIRQQFVPVLITPVLFQIIRVMAVVTAEAELQVVIFRAGVAQEDIRAMEVLVVHLLAPLVRVAVAAAVVVRLTLQLAVAVGA